MSTPTLRPAALVLSAALLAAGMASCKPKKKIAENNTQPPPNEVEVVVLCSGPEYFTNKDYFRANAVGESMDQQTAKSKALNAARGQLAADINTAVKRVVDNYVNSRELNNKEEIAERFEGLTREVTDQRLSGTRTICEKLTKTPQNTYKSYLAIELSAQDLLSEYNERLSQDERLRIDYDYEKFKETFDKEMEKLKNEH
ncbi:MAG: hypothetical protein IT228_09325 [Flavobacteriales bacterium]|nr:hypothetical protein [Flavobacteriales bacterium]MCC6577528.1 hypothetical protein [Flavobacteriales bacterium]NUQ16090.1 hypothetical protein [Flavobacteriales bacterium]